MKQFYALTIVAFFTLQSAAQFTQNFDAVNALTAGCNLSVNSDRTSLVADVISGTGSLFSNPPVNGSGTRDYATPYLNVIDPANPTATTTSLNISFNYKLNEELNGQAVRSIQVGLQSLTGFNYLAVITMDKDNDPLVPSTFNNSFIVPTGVYRLVLKMGGSQGNGTVRIIVDDLVTSANAYYNVGGNCNAAPLAMNDIFFTSNFASPTNFTSVLANDSELNDENFATPFVSAASPDGTVTFNSDGSFTFTPHLGFTGISTTFTYTVFDRGYDPTAGSGVVTIYFTSASVLPVKLTAFNGILVDNRAMLSWSVANNEDGARMEVEKSADGRNFSTTSIVINTTNSGDEKYEFKESKTLDITSYYRLKIINKNNTVSYSAVVMLTPGKTSAQPFVITENPVRNSIRFDYTATSGTTAIVNVYDILGKKLFSRQLSLQKGINTTTIELDNKIATGTYLLELVNGTERSVARFVKQ